MATGMIIDGIAASEAIDSSGEILSVEGCDISDLEEGKGVLNWEHRGEDAHGASPNDIVGAITYAKKIYKAADCEDDRQRMYWDRVKLPLIYVKCRLFDGSGHPGAIALAAMIRDYHSNGQPVLVRYSIEGSTLEKEGNHLKRSVARRVAATIKPCNKSCHSGVLEDPNGPKGESKPAEKDVLADIATRKFEHPSLMRLGGDAEFEVDPVVPEALAKADSKKTYVPSSPAPGFEPAQYEYLWHLTDKPDFKIDPSHKPTLAYGVGKPTEKPGVFLTDDPYYWGSWMGSKPALYAAKVRPSGPLARGKAHPEFFDENPQNAEVQEVLPLKEALAKYPKDFRGGSGMDWSYYTKRGKFNEKTGDYDYKELPRKGFEEEYKKYKDLTSKYRKSELSKTMTAGSGNIAPSMLTGGAALQREELSERVKKLHEMTNTAKAAVRDWDGSGDFRAFLKSRLPEADDEFLDNFADLADEYKVKKAMVKSELDLAQLNVVAKFDRLAVNLNRLLRKAEEAKEETGLEASPDAVRPISWRGHMIRPGNAIGTAKHILNKQVHVLGMDDEHVHVRHKDNGLLARWPKDGIGTKFKIFDLPERLPGKYMLDGTKHSVVPADADQHTLVHGIDFNDAGNFDGHPSQGVNARTAEYRKHPDGHTVIFKGHDQPEDDFPSQHRSAAYYAVAKNFFGLGEHVPPTAVVRHPATGQMLSAMKKVPNAYHIGENGSAAQKILKKLGDSGQLEKLALMNNILGNFDRNNLGNFLFTDQQPHLHLIDHDFTFTNTPDVPAYFHNYLSMKHPDEPLMSPTFDPNFGAKGFQDHLHPEATRWAMALNPEKFATELHKAGVPEEYRQQAIDRLVNLQTRIHNNGGKIKHAEWLKFLGEDPLVRPA